MKVIYEKTMMERITDAKEAAVREGRKIEKIILTTPEYRSLCREANFPFVSQPYGMQCCGIRVVRESGQRLSSSSMKSQEF